MFLNHILNFLQYDISQLFNDKCCVCCMKVKVSEQKDRTEANDVQQEVTVISKKNDNGKVTYEASSCSDSVNNDNIKCRTPGNKKLLSNSKCESVCQKIIKLIKDKCSTISTLELESIEERAINLWRSMHICLTDPPTKYPNWWDLKSWQKLPFYWAALSNEMLSEDPCENFKRFYMSTKKITKRNGKKYNEYALIVWHSLNTKQRLPFVIEAFVSKIAAGKINLRDEHEIQRIIADLLTY